MSNTHELRFAVRRRKKKKKDEGKKPGRQQ
jgi:hypothetical protein